MKLRARRSRKLQTALVRYYVQFDRRVGPDTQVGMNYGSPTHHVETVTDGPYSIQKIEGRVVMAMNRRDVILDSVRIIEKKVDGPVRRRTIDHAAATAA